jgi:hypothetical protein
MKTMVKIAVLVASLLLVTGLVFAQEVPPVEAPPPPPQCDDGGVRCECYEVTATDLTDPMGSWTKDWEICFNFNDECGVLLYPVGDGTKMYFALFFDSLNTEMTGVGGNFGGTSLKFHGDDFHILDGNLFCYGNVANPPFCGNGGHRYTLRGIKKDCPSGGM